jgi:hypothetical protein
MAEHNNKALDWNLVQKLERFSKAIISENDTALSILDSVEKIKEFYPAVEKALPVINVTGQNQGKLWIEGSFYEGAHRQNKRLFLGVWLSCQIDDAAVPVWIGIADDCHELYAWCPRKVFGSESPKAGIGLWRYLVEDDAYWTPLSEKDEHEEVLRKMDHEKLSKLHDTLKRAVKKVLGQKDVSNPLLQDHPKTQKM